MSEPIQAVLVIVGGLAVAALMIWGCNRLTDWQIARENKTTERNRDPKLDALIAESVERDRQVAADRRRFIIVETASFNRVWVEPAGGFGKPYF